MATFDKKAPGVYVEEISKLPPSVASVATAIPGFVGYTEKGTKNTAIRVESLIDFEEKFGYACKIAISDEENKINGLEVKTIFTSKDIPDYRAYAPSECPMCKEGKKLDAIVNSYGYSKL